MKKYNLINFKKGWIVGDFEPNILKTKDFEFGVKSYKSGDIDQTHLHKISEEITVVVNGIFDMNGEKLFSGDVVLIERNEIVTFSCIEDGNIAVIKTPSVAGDKFIIN